MSFALQEARPERLIPSFFDDQSNTCSRRSHLLKSLIADLSGVKVENVEYSKFGTYSSTA